MEITGNVLKALRFAARKHRDQRRKDREASPYVNHLIDVTHILWHQGNVRDEDTLVAAILHDTLEDTHTEAKEIEGTFGKQVRKYVEEVTDDKSLTRLERKRIQIITAPHKSLAAKQIKLADKSANVYDIAHSPPYKWSHERCIEYLDWAEEVIAGLRGVNEQLEEHFDRVLENGRKKLGKEGEQA